MRIGIYLRVSTERQIKGHSIDVQKEKGINYCEYNKYRYEIYNDAGLSASKLSIDQLPALSKMIRDLKSKRIQGIYISKVDRLIRNEDTGNHIVKVLQQTNSILINDGIEVDLHNDDAVMYFKLQQLFAVSEVNKLSSRIKVGVYSGAKKGHFSGSHIPYGYKKLGKKIEIDPIQSEIVKEIFQLSLSGKGNKSISTILNDKGYKTQNGKDFKDGTVYGILTNNIYTGFRRYRGELIPLPNLKFIDELLFNTVASEMKKRNSFKNTTNKHFYLLKGLMTCDRCGSVMYGRIKDKREETYRCNSKRNHKSVNCGSRGMNIYKLNDFVLNQLLQLPQIIKQSYDFFMNIEMSKLALLQIKEIPYQIKNIDDKIDKAFELNLSNELIENRINKLNDEKNNLLDEELRLKSLYSFYLNIDTFIDNVEKMVKPLLKSNISNDNKTTIVRSLIEDIKIRDIKHSNNHSVRIDFKIDPSSSLKIGTELTIDSFKYNQLDNIIRVTKMDGAEIANLDLDIKVSEERRWIY